MDKAIFIAMASGQNIMSAQAVHANNLANANTHGFQADFERAKTQSVDFGDGYKSRAYAVTEGIGTDFKQGALIETGRDLDISIEGEGWIAVQGKDGQEGFTRAGSLRLSPNRQLITGNGLPVLGNGGPIAIQPFDRITLGADGTITIQPEGQGADVLAVVDRIKLVKPDYQDLEKGLDGLVRRRDGEEQEFDPSIRLQSGFLESSNVDPVNEMTQIMALSRQFEINIKLMKTAEENSSSAASILRTS